MLNVKIQNEKTNVQSTNYMSRFCRISCENSTGLVSLTDYHDKYLSNMLLRIQADSGVDTEAVVASAESTEQNVGFNDSDNNVISSIPHPMSYTKVDNSQNVDLGDFLKRPVQIQEFSWTVGGTLDAATDNFHPWNLFFNHTSIKKKLDNYYMVRCNLHLKFVINASPFYYGCAIASYQPMTNFNPAPVILSSAGRLENIPFSQRPHIYLYPANSQGGEMVLPFLYHKNWLDATSSTDLTEMGAIFVNSFDTLKVASTSTSPIRITVYAWAEDIEVAGPTVRLAVQGKRGKKDEYSHEGTVSKPASAIARAAGSLSSVPIIGPFATATSYAAEAVSEIASLFGYTDVPVIDDVHAYVPKPFPNMAATDIGHPIEKLTLDSKNELTIDPKIAGADVSDELLISSFVTRESYIFSTSWSATDTINTSLFYSRVTPRLQATESITNGDTIYATPMSHVARCFKYWRGDLIYKFKFICTKFHQGRVRINWDPRGDIASSGDYTTETYTRIVDISEENEIEFTVPYTQLTSYLNVDTSIGQVFGSSGILTTAVGSKYNGLLTMRVLNQQTSPITTADIDILVFVRASDNMEFCAPVDLDNTISPYAIQGDFDSGNTQFDLGTKPSTTDPNTNLIYMGEHVSSLRQLMRRSSMYRRINETANVVLQRHCTMRSVLGRSLAYPGYDTYGYNTAIGLTSAVSEPYNWVCWTYTTWFSTCFVGSRGSYHYYVNGSYLQGSNAVTVARSTETHTSSNFLITNFDDPGTGNLDYERRVCDGENQSLGMTGLNIVNQRTMAGNNTSVPMYSRYKFLSNSVLSRNNGKLDDESNSDSIAITMLYPTNADLSSDHAHLDIYASAGTDFNLIFFLNVPVLYHYDSLPVVP
jgi:hypothetical protein